MKVCEAKEITGGGIQTRNSKMPGSSYGTDPFRCLTGGKMRQVEGSTCSRCYACKIARMRPNVGKGYANRHDAFRAACEAYEANANAVLGDALAWVEAMAWMIKREALKTGQAFHRWFDAGDMPHRAALALIAAVARRTPQVKHWVPTREAKWLATYNPEHLPENLVVRLSATKIDGSAPKSWPTTSGVHKATTPEGHLCPAAHQGGQCGDCRACWSKAVGHVSYHLH